MAAQNLPSRTFLNIRTIRLLLSVLALGGLGVVFFLALADYLSSEEVALPDLVGLDAAEATNVLARLDIEARTYTEVVPGTPVNTVTSQSPDAGVLVRPGRTVAVGVNVPTNDIEVPLLVGRTRAQAISVLNELGLVLGEVSYESSEIAEGEIISQVPERGAVLSNEDSVDVTISRGPPLVTFPMPQLKGLSVAAATRRLRELGVRTIDSRATSVSRNRPNIVADQLPAAGQEVSASTRVVLGYSLPARNVVQVPSLIGTPLRQVQTSLRRAGLSLGAVLYIDDPAKDPGIVNFAPSGYTLRNSPVEVTINRTGLSESVADIRTPTTGGSSLDFPPTTGVGPSIPDEAQGSISVRPTPNALRDRDTSGTATSSGTSPTATATPLTSAVQADGGRLVPFRFDPATSGIPSLAGKPVRLRLEVEDERGERVLLNQNVPAGQTVDIRVSVYGEATMRTYINDVLFQNWNPL